ncbi:NUDIX hydrolase [Yoonia sp.]|uniref:NUDIX hydrolase n=1 Tax=Yoonia sp. TaxID=2212373 RepID=UPI0025F1D598|nr:NUDIX hydrolase [Yoonia sp.]
MIRRYGEAPLSAQRYQVRHGAYAVLRRDGQVLLTRQKAEQDELQLPGGGIDPGEGAIQALHRETYEETGWRIARPRRLGAFRRFTYMPEYDKWAEKVCHIYQAFPVRRLGPPTEPGHTAIWMDQDAAVSLLFNEGDAAFLAQLILAS